MIAGRMRYRLKVFEPVVSVDKFKAERTTWVERNTIWAERLKNTGYRHDEVAEPFADYRAEYNIRSVHPVGENWRVEEVGGLTYNVVAVIPNRERGMTTLICERFNR